MTEKTIHKRGRKQGDQTRAEQLQFIETAIAERGGSMHQHELVRMLNEHFQQSRWNSIYYVKIAIAEQIITSAKQSTRRTLLTLKGGANGR